MSDINDLLEKYLATHAKAKEKLSDKKEEPLPTRILQK